MIDDRVDVHENAIFGCDRDVRVLDRDFDCHHDDHVAVDVDENASVDCDHESVLDIDCDDHHDDGHYDMSDHVDVHGNASVLDQNNIFEVVVLEVHSLNL